MSNKCKEQTIYNFDDLLELLPYGRTRLQELLRAGVIPSVKIGRKYLSTPEMIDEWLRENSGKTVL